MELTVEQLKEPSVQISLNGHQYYLARHIIDKYFVTSNINSDRFVDIHDYTVFDDNNPSCVIKAPVEICDIIALELATDFRNNLMKKDIESNQNNWLFYYNFCDLYLNIDLFILGGPIAIINGHFNSFYNYVRNKRIIYNENTYNLIGATILDAIKQVFDTEYPVIARSFNERHSKTKLENDTWHVNIMRGDCCMLIFWQLFKVSKINLFDIFCDKIEVPEIYHRFLKLDPNDFSV